MNSSTNGEETVGLFDDPLNRPSAPTKVIRSYDSFGRYVNRVQKNLFPDLRISANEVSLVDSAVKTLCKALGTEAHLLAKKDGRSTIQPRDIEFACRFVFLDDMAEQAVKVGSDAVKSAMDWGHEDNV